MRKTSLTATAVLFSCYCLLAFVPGSLAADAAKLSVAKAPPPEEVAEPIRKVLDAQAIRLSEGEQPFFEIWLRKDLPLDKKPIGELSAAVIPEGTLLGVIKVNQERYDFRDEEIPPGLYTLRLGLQPVDGNHLGVSPTRTFALLIPAEDDKELKAYTEHDRLAEAAAEVNAAGHPSNLNLQEVQEPGGNEFPRLAEHSGGEHKVVYLRIPAKIEGSDEMVQIPVALVYEGMGMI